MLNHTIDIVKKVKTKFYTVQIITVSDTIR